MINLRSLTIYVIAFSFFIIIGAGHGIACIGILEVMALIHGFGIGTAHFSLSLTADYDTSIVAVALFALIGHILLALSLSTKKISVTFWIKVIGIIFLYISFYYLIHNFFIDDLAQVSFFTGIPFLICSFLLLYKTIAVYCTKALQTK